MLLLEVLVCEFLSVDRFSTGALSEPSSACVRRSFQRTTHIAASEVTSLEHEFGDHTVEFRVFVAEALLARAQRAEVLDGLGDNVIEEVEVDATRLSYSNHSQRKGCDVKMH